MTTGIAGSSVPSPGIPPGRMRRMQLREAQWVFAEMQDFVRLTQRYRATYLAAVFAAIGWLLGQALGPGSKEQTLDALRQRGDIAAVLCVVPLLNAFFVVLLFEAQFQMQSLARYRFVLGHELGEGSPVWRWELWKETTEGSYRTWTNPSNIVFGVVALTLPTAALWFGFPAVWNSHGALLWSFWLFSATVFTALIVLAIVLGITNIDKNTVGRPRRTRWSDLLPKEPTRRRHWWEFGR